MRCLDKNSGRFGMVKTLALMDLVYLWYVYKCIPEGIIRSLSIELSGVTPIAASKKKYHRISNFEKNLRLKNLPTSHRIHAKWYILNLAAKPSHGKQHKTLPTWSKWWVHFFCFKIITQLILRNFGESCRRNCIF